MSQLINQSRLMHFWGVTPPNASMKRSARVIALVLAFLSGAGTADAGCQAWNGCQHRVEKNLAAFRTHATEYVELSKKCIDVLNDEKSHVAIYHPACLDAQQVLSKLSNPESDDDQVAHMTPDDRMLVYEVRKQASIIRNLSDVYETPAERDSQRQIAAQQVAEQQADEARSRARTAAIVGALAASGQDAANSMRPPATVTCFSQQAPFNGGGTTTCLQH